jgi:hypothetical protein
MLSTSFLTTAVALCAAIFSDAKPVRRRDVGNALSVYNEKGWLAEPIKNAMLGSIRTSWEQGTAANGVQEIENPEYSYFAATPFQNNGNIPVGALTLALSAAVRQAEDGRLSQVINDGLDGAALDGASSGPYTLLGTSLRTLVVDLQRLMTLNFCVQVLSPTQKGKNSGKMLLSTKWTT